ncbi:MAG: hypothetical protein ACHQ4H_17160 [Ktedonobacterales bacterium]
MPQEPVIEALIVSRHEQPPQSAALLRALAAAGLGTGEFEPPPAGTEIVPPAPGSRKRLGTYTLAVAGTAARVRMVVWRYGSPVTEGMGDAALNGLARDLSPDDATTLRTGTTSLDLRQAATAALRPLAALDFALKVTHVVLDQTDGVCIDPAAQRALGRAQFAQLTAGDPLAHVSVHDEAWDADARWLHTHGMQKFARAELDLVGVPVSLELEARALLRDVAISLIGGAELAAGDEVDLGDAGMAEVVAVAADVDHLAPFGRLRLVDSAREGARADETAARLLARVALAEAVRRLQQGDRAGASEIIERVLAADPDECGALALQARLRLAAGQALAALDVSEYMQLRVPDDYRGPLVAGLALAALGRYREARAALDRSLRLNPEAAESFAARASVLERLGDPRRAEEDRAHARYLGYRA